MLAIAQTLAGVGHAGLMVCREDSRTTRIELSISGCCGETEANTGIDIVCDNDQLALPVLNHCSEGDCLDEPVDVGPALTRKQFHEENRDVGVPARPALLQPATAFAAPRSEFRAGLRLVKRERGNCGTTMLRTVVLVV